MVMQPKTMQGLWQDSYLGAGSEGYLDQLYETYLSQPSELDPAWRDYFDQLVKQIRWLQQKFHTVLFANN